MSIYSSCTNASFCVENYSLTADHFIFTAIGTRVIIFDCCWMKYFEDKTSKMKSFGDTQDGIREIITISIGATMRSSTIPNQRHLSLNHIENNGNLLKLMQKLESKRFI